MYGYGINIYDSICLDIAMAMTNRVNTLYASCNVTPRPELPLMTMNAIMRLVTLNILRLT